MSSFDAQNSKGDHEKEISEIIQGELIDLYGANGYKSIMQTMTKICEHSKTSAHPRQGCQKTTNN